MNQPPDETCHALRRRVLLAPFGLPLLGGLSGCLATLPSPQESATGPAAAALLADSARAHGLEALGGVNDLSIRYTGAWHALVARLQPALVDAGHRGGSEERMLPGAGLIAQVHTGPRGRKQVLRRWVSGTQGEVRVRFDGVEAQDPERRAAAALVADGYSLFLLGPMLLAQRWGTERTLTLSLGVPQSLRLDHATCHCDVVLAGLRPGLGFSGEDRLMLFIDRRDGLMRRVRFSLNGLESTQGAVAEVDSFDHVRRQGIAWPTRFHEHLRRPAPLPVHDWHVTGLDLNRGLSPEDLSGPEFTAAASVPATPL
jgi:hypothetical protein